MKQPHEKPEATTRGVLQDDVRDSVERIIDYYWDEVKADHSKLLRTAPVRGHMFESLSHVKSWLLREYEQSQTIRPQINQSKDVDDAWSTEETLVAYRYIVDDQQRRSQWRRRARNIRSSVLERHADKTHKHELNDQSACELAWDMAAGEVNTYAASGFCAVLFQQALWRVNWKELAERFVLSEPLITHQ